MLTKENTEQGRLGRNEHLAAPGRRGQLSRCWQAVGIAGRGSMSWADLPDPKGLLPLG